MKIKNTPFEGLLIIEPKAFNDDRGSFFESYHFQKYDAFGIKKTFVQDNISHSHKAVLRGLHYQVKNPQAKLVSVLNGEVFDVVVDIRPSSSTFGKWFGQILSGQNRLQMFIPEGFAHGFCVLSESADFYYKCSDYYCPEGERGIIWNDPQLKIIWPIENPILSEKDAKNSLFANINTKEISEIWV